MESKQEEARKLLSEKKRTVRNDKVSAASRKNAVVVGDGAPKMIHKMPRAPWIGIGTSASTTSTVQGELDKLRRFSNLFMKLRT